MAGSPLTVETVEAVLDRLPRLRVGVLGDLFLDRYFDLDATLTELSLETGLDAYQVVRVRSYPGAAGTVVNNLSALGVGEVRPVALIGDDGEGHELRQALARLPGVVADGVRCWPGLRTPTYLKPMLGGPGRAPGELNRFDVLNRDPLDPAAEALLVELFDRLWAAVDAVIVLDQVSLPDRGVVTARLRLRLADAARTDPARPALADSRERIGMFRHVSLKPNQRELMRAVPGVELEEAARRLAAQAGRPVFCTRGERGIVLSVPGYDPVEVPAFAVSGPTDPVGAGDSTSAGIVSALAAGATPAQAAAFGNLVASITVRQVGTTGTASPAQVRQRFGEIEEKGEEKW